MLWQCCSWAYGKIVFWLVSCPNMDGRSLSEMLMWYVVCVHTHTVNTSFCLPGCEMLSWLKPQAHTYMHCVASEEKKKKDYFSKWIHSTLFGKCAHGQVLFYISLIVNKTPEKAKSINVSSAFLTGWNMSECLFTCTWSLPLIIINKYKTWFSFSPLERAREGVREGKKSDTALHLCVLFMSLKL